ncbi:MAG: DUF3276 family protein [Treponemataceae bacterium]
MGTRGEIFTKPVKARNRTYFFNVKENTKGDIFLQVVESKDTDGAGFERHSIVVFEDELQDFLKGLDESLGFIEANRKAQSKARFERFQESRKREGSPRSKREKSEYSSSKVSKKQEGNRASLFKKKTKKVVKIYPKDKKR